MPLVEVIVGDDTSRETATAAYNFAQAIKKQPIVCAEVPGFVVNKILMATIGEIWRAQEDQGLSLKAIDEAIAAANVAPMGPFFLTDLLGLDTVFHTAEHLHESYGETFYVHKGLKQLVADGKLGAKTGGEGFYKDGEQTVPGDAEPDAEELVAMFTCRALIEACLLVEEGVCSVRDIDVGMMAGAGLDPAPRPAAAVLESRRRRARHGPRADGEAGGEVRRALRAAGHPQAPGRPGPPRPRHRPGLLPLPAARRGRPGRRRSSSRPAATSRSPGSPTCR